MSPLLSGPAPRWFSIPAHRPFVQDLARGLFDALTPLGPEALSQAVVLTPTRRGARSLADAFSRARQPHDCTPPLRSSAPTKFFSVPQSQRTVQDAFLPFAPA